MANIYYYPFQNGNELTLIGTKIEMQYKLMGYGIPVSHIPATDTGAVKVKNHNQWLRIRKLLEKDPTAHANICECPSLNDVLFRRAGSCIAHPGNAIYTNLIESKKAEHTNSSQTDISGSASTHLTMFITTQ